MKKILIVSGQKYSKTNRGIDIITEYLLEKKFKVDHLVFGINKLKNIEKDFSMNNIYFTQHYSKDSYFSYLGVMGDILPSFFLEWVKRKTIKTVNHINFNNYDLIILETGKPLFLMEIIPKNIPIICRQSDPIEISIKSKKRYFKNMEEKAIKRSFFTLVAHHKAVQEYALSSKIIEWKSGFESKKIEMIENKLTNKDSIVYMGMFKIDYFLIKGLAQKFPNIIINIVGPYKDKLNIKNVKFHGYLEYEEYFKLIKESFCFFIPYHDFEVKRMLKLGMTSKFYIPMNLGKPILSRAYGSIEKDLEEYNIYIYKNIEEAIMKLCYIKKNKFNKNEKIELFLERLKICNRKMELDKIFKNEYIV